jgi:ubiquinone/menaquinone biosynthesis C-methylase UbiE
VPESLVCNGVVKDYWEARPCGTSKSVVGNLPEQSLEWFERVEAHRYATEPFIHSIAQFTRHRGKRLLEVGVGAGTDHLQWARAGAICYGVDLTAAAIDITKAHLDAYGLQSNLQRADAETLPFPEKYFEVVYSWGVIHHAEHPSAIVDEIHRVLKPGGTFIGMMYGRHSLKVLKHWACYALLRGKPWLTFRQVISRHVESSGTQAYTVSELRALFSRFSQFSANPQITAYDRRGLPNALVKLCPERFGWFIAIHATK